MSNERKAVRAMSMTDSASRVNEAYEWLLAEITAFRLSSGAPLSENRIATQLGISRTPVREALQRLETEGLVRRTDNARFSVSTLTPREVNEACDLLEVLDTYIFVKAAREHDEAVSTQIIEVVDEMMAAAEAGDKTAWSEADIRFHRLVNEVAGNQLVSETVKHTRRRIQRFWTRAASAQSRLVGCSAEHVELAKAIVARDTEAIPPAVQKHIGHMRVSILEKLEAASVFFG
ncbi:GntR family transcriptional regulator [Microbacterium aquimaris]|uniref:GntR family transcriptional regulator n=1 Tax=Microbacterium aquimaris TaxID=459816 RepID=A0ABU5N4E6_9MICO|nr:GntR family transcriptional regulator [Microbacterium aquimaris]MDZ8160941.1 GntR family transcriptional regulator [Microbacterium aquimaris]